MFWKIFNYLNDLLNSNPRMDEKTRTVIKKVKAFTMLNDARLVNILALANQVIDGKVKGDFVECGTCRGGSGALMAHVAKNEGWKRKVWLFDSFEGHPKPNNKSGKDKNLMTEWAGTMVASEADVVKAVKSVDAYKKDKVKIVKGWFQKTVSKSKIGKVALVHIDGDWYDSTKFCLEELYEIVEPGGVLVIDDYANKQFPGVKDAVDEFFGNREGEIEERFEVYPALVLRKG